MKKLEPDYISISVGTKPNLENFVNINSFDLGSEAGKFKEEKSSSYYFNSQLNLLLQSFDSNEYKDFFIVFGKTKSVLKYLEGNYPEEHLRLYNYLKCGLDSEFVKEILLDHGSPVYLEAYEELSGIKIIPKEDKK